MWREVYYYLFFIWKLAREGTQEKRKKKSNPWPLVPPKKIRIETILQANLRDLIVTDFTLDL